MSSIGVSVIIPTFNSGRLVTEAIDSVLAQTVPCAEIIVVDDGSRDDTSQRLAPYRDRIRYVHQENQGVAAARNQGLQLARGDVVGFLDADDVWHPRKTEVQLAALTARPGLGLLGTERFDWPGIMPPEIDHATTGSVTVVPWDRLVVRNYFTTSSILARRDILQQAGPFDTRLRCAQDHDLWLRVAEIAPVANLNLALTGYRSLPGSLSKQAASKQAGMERVLQKVDERQAWRGRWLLRCKAHSYLHCCCSYVHSVAGNRKEALANILCSFAWYPLPYGRSDVDAWLARPRLLSAALRRWLRAAGADGQSQLT